MYFKQILDDRCGCASYVIASRESHEAAIVDPSIQVQQYIDLIEERDFTLRYVIDTHVHADHVSGARKLAARFGAEVCLYETAQVAYPFRRLSDGEELLVGQIQLRILHTPGHRAELISILITNPLRSPEPSMVLTADCLLVGDMGRPDFGGGDANAQYDSLNRLLRLPDWVAVFPGHFEGACGKGMCGRPSTTVGFERLYNPLARLDRSAFVQLLGSGIPARPLNVNAIEATNRGLADMPWAMLTTSARVAEISSAEVPPEAFLLDVREPAEYAHGHIPGAASIPQADLAIRQHEIPTDRPLVVVCQGGYRSYRAAQYLNQVGFKDTYSLRGGTGAWESSGRPLAFGDTSLDLPRVAESAWAHAGVIG